jgi:hypothetical protein
VYMNPTEVYDVHSYVRSILAKKYNVEVKQSLLGDFHGLFTTSIIRKDDLICIYYGISYSTVQAMRIPSKDRDYLMRLGEQSYVDARECPHILAR